MFFEHSNWLSLFLNSICSSNTWLLFHILSCTLSPFLHKCSASVFSPTMIFPFVIARHSCHRCIYLAVAIIFSDFVCTITFFHKTYLLWKFCDHVIFISTSKAFQGVRSICLLDETSTARDFSFSFLILLKHFSAEWLTPSQIVHSVWTACALSLSQ